MLHVLALSFGCPDVEQLEETLSDRQFRRWQQFFALHPWGPHIDWHRHGAIASLLVNTAPNRKRGAKPVKPTDFIPKPMTRKQNRMGIRAMFKQIGKKDE